MRRHVLLADNDELLRGLLGAALAEAGYRVSTAANGQEVLQQMEEGRPDVLILDLVMPRLDGARVCRHLKADARFASLPILMLTGAVPEAAGCLEDLPADGYLAKRAATDMIRELLDWLQALEQGRPPRPEAEPELPPPRQIVRELLAETAQLTAILQNLGDGVLLLDAEGRVLFENPAGAELLGVEEGELLNVRLDTALERSAAHACSGALRELAAPGPSQTARFEMKHLDRVLRVTLTGLHEQARRTGFVLLLHDMTAMSRRLQERTAELESALKAKAEFLAKVSHELRTPLNFILGFTDLLRRQQAGPLTAKQARYLSHVQTGGQHLLDLVTNLLELSLADAGHGPLELESVPLEDVVGELLDLFSLQFEQKRLVVEARVTPGLHVVAERRKLVQILANLLGNAAKFTPEGGRVVVAARPAGEGRAVPVEISVSDTGVGMDAHDLERIFLGFQQVPGAAGDRPAGVGIGLPLVRALVERHGGRVWAESPGLGQGSRFLVRLPPLDLPRRKRILIVEDDAHVIEALSTLLCGAGYAVDHAGTGEDGLAALEGGRPDLVLLDLGLPDMDGLVVLRRLRAHPRAGTLPVLVLTARGQADAEAAIPEGADDFLTKPFSPSVLLRTVGSLLSAAGGRAHRPVRHHA
jgi:PAS domain S-box-containing protein